ncbi:Ktr system potassium uptake protein A [uncultured Clostridium sp.]|uniref:potassium channel family protein n=1 Tax=uncultured Clostridium sp. TaxID=59620 RepID=UPI000822C7CA|nr:TrkA family potassium uptake protein [uncultured Clostridium sp.]SCJ40150.1 Ktr system potassium uptake protein A [uncultured Clostridium sp.]
MFNYKSVVEFGIIGIGRFGFSLAKALIEAGRDVIVLDSDESKIKHIRALTDNAFVVDNLDKETLQETGIQNCKTVFVCIGEKIDISILTTLNVINLGVPRVISKAITYEQGCVLEKIGAEVVYPESDMAIRIANRLLNEEALEFIELNNDIHIEKVKITSKLDSKTISQSKIRDDFNLNIIAMERGRNTIIEIDPSHILREDDLIVVIGKKNNIRNLEDFLGNN